jgi:hypothetical protein
MTGKELFDQYQAAALRHGFGSAEFSYGNVLFEAMKLEGEASVFSKLEEANANGRKIRLAYSKPPSDPETEPDLVVVA